MFAMTKENSMQCYGMRFQCYDMRFKGYAKLCYGICFKNYAWIDCISMDILPILLVLHLNLTSIVAMNLKHVLLKNKSLILRFVYEEFISTCTVLFYMWYC